MTQAAVVEKASGDRAAGLPLGSPMAGVRRVGRWVLLVLALVSVGVYANSLVNGFALDDTAIVEHNDRVNSLEWTEIWTTNYWPPQDGATPDVLYRPLTMWSYLATQAMAPDALWAHHLGNMLLHALVAVMSVVLAWRLFGNRAVAILTGLLFALHPLHTEVVANVVGRAELLAAVFSLAALLVYLPDRRAPGRTGPSKRGYWHGWLAAACFLLAMLSKETPVAALGGFVFIDYWRWSQWEKTTRPSLMRWMGRQTWRYYTPLGAAFGLYMAMRIGACGLMREVSNIHPIVNPLVTAGMMERLVTPFALLTKYLHVTFWPKVLSADYSFPSLLPTANPLSPAPLTGILLVGLAGIGCVKLWRKAPSVVLTIGLFACSYALISNFLRIGTILGERLFYLPSLFVLMLISWGAVTAYRAMGDGRGAAARKWAAIGVTAAACVAMTVRTVIRNTDWHDNIPLAIATARDNPGSAKACYWAGCILAMSGPDDKTKAFGAELFKHAIELYPHYGLAYFELAKYEGRNGHLGKSLVYLAQAAKYAPGVNDIRGALIAIKEDLKAHAVEDYMPDLREFQAARPQDAAVDLAFGVALVAQGKLEEGEKSYTEAIKKDSRFHEAACELALVRFDRGEQEQASMLGQYVDHISCNLESRVHAGERLLRADLKKYPHALEAAKKYLDEADGISKGNGQVRELRGELSRKRAAVNALAAEVPGRAVSVGSDGANAGIARHAIEGVQP